MEKEDEKRVIKAIKQKNLDQLDSANNWSLVFIDNETSSIYSIDTSLYEMILNGLMDVDNIYINQQSYLFNGYRFYSIEFDSPF